MTNDLMIKSESRMKLEFGAFAATVCDYKTLIATAVISSFWAVLPENVRTAW